jgi:type II secretory pathway predicted ATPase ExeA
MFLDYYHLREQPFGVTPDPRYLYLSRAHREALASLYYGVQAGRGFMALIAEPGMGKTTLLMQLLERLRKSACVAFLFQTQCNSRELLRYLMADMGLESREQDFVNLHAQLNQALIRMSRAGKRFVLVIDEAQNLDSSVLETVRLLSDFETPSSKLIQIVLSGQPQLADKLARLPLVQLRQRIAILGRLDPFSPEETGKYIGHRLRIAGHDGSPIFTSGAINIIAAQSRGIPRNINNLCFSALSLGCALGRSKIDREILLEAVRDLEMEPLGNIRQPAKVEVPPLPPAPAAQPRSAPRSVRQIRFGHGLIWSAALGASCFLAFLLLFPSVRSACRTSFTRAFAPSLPEARLIQQHYRSIPLFVSATLRGPKDALPTRTSGAVAPNGNSTVTVEAKSGKTFYQVCVGECGRFARDLVQQIRALNPQIADLKHIAVGLRNVLPGRTRTSTGNSPAGLGNSDPTTSARN